MMRMTRNVSCPHQGQRVYVQIGAVRMHGTIIDVRPAAARIDDLSGMQSFESFDVLLLDGRVIEGARYLDGVRVVTSSHTSTQPTA